MYGGFGLLEKMIRLVLRPLVMVGGGGLYSRVRVASHICGHWAVTSARKHTVDVID